MTTTPPEQPTGSTMNSPQWPEDGADGFQPSYHRQHRKSRQHIFDNDCDNTTHSATTSPRIVPSSLASPQIVPSASLSTPTPRTPILSSSSPNLLSKPRPSPKLSASGLPAAKTANAFALLDISNASRYKTTIEEGSSSTSPHQSLTAGRRKRKHKSPQLGFPDHSTPPGSPLTVSPSTSTTSAVATPSSLLKNSSQPVSPVLGPFLLKTDEDSREPFNKNSNRKPSSSSHHISNAKASSPTTTPITTTTTTPNLPVLSPDPRDPSNPHELPTVLEHPGEASKNNHTFASKTADTTQPSRRHLHASSSKLNTSHPKRATAPPAPPAAPPTPPKTPPSLAGAHHTHDIPTFTIWDYLTDELTASDFDIQQELKREKVANFLGVPAAIEKLMLFGYVVCLDSFLYTFTILPMRFSIALFYLLRNAARHADAWWNKRVEQSHLKLSEKCDLLKGTLVLLTCIAMQSIDASRLYHSIRGQAVIKLYVIFNVLEICDRLCCSFGTDILDALFSKSTLVDGEGDGHGGHARRHLRPVTFFLLALGYMLLHTMVLFFQMVTLNVAINFYSNELLTLLISNQFVEIKGSVFKKFERENLFQLSCSDIVERFQQSIFLLIITLRNVIELSESPPSPFSILPSTFVPLFKLPTNTTFDSLLTPVFMVIVSELLVDWLKHAFITKFNQIRPSVYDKYIDVLCRDLVIGSPGRVGGRKNTFVDQSPVVSRRIGFPALPLACVLIRIAIQTASMIRAHSPSLTSSDYPLEPMAFPTPDLNTPQPSAGIIYFVVHEGIWGKGWADRWPLVVEWAMWGGRMVMWGGGVGLVFVCLIAIKLVVGTNLLTFAYRRYATMQQRDERETEREKEMKNIEREEKMRPEFNDPRDNLLGVIPPKLTLDNIDRFSMVRSQIP